MSFDLNRGIAIIIDDKLHSEGDAINKISQIISAKGIPFCGYSNLKDASSCIQNFLSVNFVVLDWKLSVPEGVPFNGAIRKANAKYNIEFIKEFQKYCFAPIFIFSAETEDDILDDLFKHGGKELIGDDHSRNFILIKAKVDLIENDNLFKAVDEWVKNNPAIYTLKAWESSFMQSKNETFWHLFNRSPLWPKILWDNYSKDLVDEDINLMDVVNKNITSRTKFIRHEKEVIQGYKGVISKDEIKGVIQGVMYADNKVLSEFDLQPGDIFKIDKNYYLNLRPICDTVIGRMEANGEGNQACDGDFYAIRGSKMSANNINDRYDKSLEMLNERSNEIILYGVDGKDFFQFNFKKSYVFSYTEHKSKRISRLLSPYINNVQQKYSSYIGRFGLPRMPIQIIEDLLPKADKVKA